MSFKLPATTPIVTCTDDMVIGQYFVIEASMFEDNKTRVIAPANTSAETIDAIIAILYNYDQNIGRMHYITGLLKGENR